MPGGAPSMLTWKCPTELVAQEQGQGGKSCVFTQPAQRRGFCWAPGLLRVQQDEFAVLCSVPRRSSQGCGLSKVGRRSGGAVTLDSIISNVSKWCDEP